MQTFDYDGKCVKVGDDIAYILECEDVRRWEFANILHIDESTNMVIRRYRYERRPIKINNGQLTNSFVPKINPKILGTDMFVLTRSTFSQRGTYEIQTSSILLDPNDDEDRMKVIYIYLYDKDETYTIYRR